MGAVAATAYFLLGCGPPLVFYCFFVARKSFLVLLTLASAFIWLVTLLFIAALAKGFGPLGDAPGAYAAVLVVSVAIQEAVRYGVWRLHSKTLLALDQVVRATPGTHLSRLDKLSMAMTHGFGHGATHSAFFFASWLPLTMGKGTYYADSCPQMPFFLALSLLTLGFFILLTFCMVLSFDSFDKGSYKKASIPASLHMVAALVTLANFRHNGCSFSIPAVGVIAIIAMTLALKVCWDTLQTTTNSQRVDD